MSAPSLTVERAVLGPWSLATSREFWEGFAPQRLRGTFPEAALTTTFLAERSWMPVRAEVTQHGSTARITVTTAAPGPVELDRAAEQVARFLSLDVDGTPWPGIGEHDPVIGEAQVAFPGLRPCGFHSPYEAAAWLVLSQRVRISQGAALRDRLVRELGAAGAFPAPEALLRADLDLPGRKAEYLRAVAEAALDGRLDAATLRALDPAAALARVRTILGIGPFAAELVVIRGANAPDLLPAHEGRLEQEIRLRYGPGDQAQRAEAWRPLRSWAAVHLRALREERASTGTGRRAGCGATSAA